MREFIFGVVFDIALGTTRKRLAVAEALESPPRNRAGARIRYHHSLALFDQCVPDHDGCHRAFRRWNAVSRRTFRMEWNRRTRTLRRLRCAIRRIVGLQVQEPSPCPRLVTHTRRWLQFSLGTLFVW